VFGISKVVQEKAAGRCRARISDRRTRQVGGVDEPAGFDRLAVSANDKNSSEIVKTRIGTLDDPVYGGTYSSDSTAERLNGIYNQFSY
jgi:hypothetical protein